MPIKIVRRPKESSQDVAKRFSKTVKKSGILLEMRKKAFKIRAKSDKVKKKSALRRIELRKKYEKLKKLGKFYR